MNFNPNRSQTAHFFLLTLIFCLFAGCASVSIEQTTTTPPPAAKLPEKILVRGFETPVSAFRVDRDGEALSNFLHEKRERMTRNLVRRLSENIAPAEAIAVTAPAPKGNYWLLEGRFERVNQGSRALRSLVGFGLGGTKLETVSVLSDLSTGKPRPILEIRTTGGSNAEPGAIAGFSPWGIPWGMGVNAIFGARTGLGFDTVRTSREITAAISEYAHEQGLLPEEQLIRPKRAGRLPHHVSRFVPGYPAE